MGEMTLIEAMAILMMIAKRVVDKFTTEEKGAPAESLHGIMKAIRIIEEEVRESRDEMEAGLKALKFLESKKFIEEVEEIINNACSG